MEPAPANRNPGSPPGMETTWAAPGVPSAAPVPETRDDRAAATPLDPAPTTPYGGRPSTPFQPYRFGDYQILELLGGGGMGTVYRALNIWLNREEALKVISAGRLASIESRRRFQEEMQSTARLRHPNIVEVFAAGAVDGEPYFTMSLETGGDLAQLTRDGKLPSAQQVAEVVRQVAEGVAYAHRQGLVHRDLKPSNVLLGANGQPRVTDFGLALLLDAGTSATGVEGTPGYMAPEQAEGGAEAAGKLCDVYGLGAILYELLTGKPPFQGDSVAETLRRVCTEAPTPPRAINPRTPRNLEMICLKCLEKNPRSRYACASEVAAALSAFVQPTWRRSVRPTATVLTVVLVLVLGGLLVWKGYSDWSDEWRRLGQLRLTAQTHVAAAHDAARQGRRSQALDAYVLAQDGYRELIDRQPDLPDRPALRLALAQVRMQRGLLLREQQQLAAAQEAFEAALVELKALEDRAPDLAEWRLHLAEVLHNLGILCNARGTPEEQRQALSWYRQGLELRELLVQAAPHNRVFRRDLARSHGYMGDTELQLGLHDEAAASYENAARLREELVIEIRRSGGSEAELLEALCQRSRDFGNTAAFHDWIDNRDAAVTALEQRRRYFDEEAFPEMLPGPFRTDRVNNLLLLAELLLQGSEVPGPEVLELLAAVREECKCLTEVLDEKDCLDVLKCRAGAAVAEGAHEIRRGRPAAARAPLELAVKMLKHVETAGVAEVNDLYRHAVANALLAALAAGPADRGFHEGLALDRLELVVQRGYRNRAHLEREPGFRLLRDSRPAQFRQATTAPASD